MQTRRKPLSNDPHHVKSLILMPRPGRRAARESDTRVGTAEMAEGFRSRRLDAGRAPGRGLRQRPELGVLREVRL